MLKKIRVHGKDSGESKWKRPRKVKRTSGNTHCFTFAWVSVPKNWGYLFSWGMGKCVSVVRIFYIRVYVCLASSVAIPTMKYNLFSSP